MTTKVEEFEIDDEEAQILGRATTRLTDLYEIPIPSDKVLAWIGLANALGKVYGPRVIAIKLRSRNRPKIVEGNFRPAPQPTPEAVKAQRDAVARMAADKAAKNQPQPNTAMFEEAPTMASF